jgi:hypothetical protein
VRTAVLVRFCADPEATIDASRRGRPSRAPGVLRGRVARSDVLVGAASFCVVLAVLLHVLAAGRAAQTVPDVRIVVRSVATGATVLVPGELEPRQGVTLHRSRTIDPVPAPVPDVDAYVVSTSIQLLDGTFVGRDRWTGVQERVTGLVVPSPVNSELVTTFDQNGSSVEERRPLRGMGGVLLRFPRDTPDRDQARWDPATRSVGVAEVTGTSRIDGADVMELVQRSASTVGGVRTTAETRLSVRRETGSIVREDLQVRAQRDDGTVVLQARFVDEEESVRRASSTVDRAVDRQRVVGVVIPAVILVVGTMVALVAVLAGYSGRLKNRLRRVHREEGQ